MAQVKVTINNKELPNVIAVELGIDVDQAADGDTHSEPKLTTITVQRESDTDTRLWDWSLKPSADGYQNGQIDFMKPNEKDKVNRTIKWKDGFVHAYREMLPDTNLGAPLVEEVEISARIVDFGGGEHEGYKK